MNTLRPHHASQQTARGFSITELLVSISLIGLLIGLLFPVISIMSTSSRVEAGLNIVGMSSDVARQWVQAEAWANDASTQQPVNEIYNGTAALYCPTGEIRIVVNDRNAQSNSNAYLEDLTTGQNGYKDLTKVDYIRIPDNVGIAGIFKNPNNGNVRLLAPPFAIAFNEAGQLNYGDSLGYIYYDADGSNTYSLGTGGRRSGTYNPSEWTGDPGSPNYDSSKLSQDLPFEAIECVPGVIVYSADKFREAGFDFDGGGGVSLTSSEGNWLQENGETVFFSPHTGIVLRDEQE